MNILEQLCTPVLGKVDTLCKSYLEEATLLFIFRVYNSKQYNGALLECFPTSNASDRLKFKQSILSNGYIMCNLKLFIFRLILLGVKRKHYFTIRSISTSYGISANDLSLLNAISGLLYKHLRAWKSTYKSHTVQSLTKSIETCINILDSQGYIAKFYYRKLRFTASTTSDTYEDTSNELKAHAIQQLYFMYPQIESRLHAVNIMKRVIRQHGLNLIESCTKQKRAILYEDEKGNTQSTNVSLTLLSDYVDTEVMSKFCVGLQGNGNDYDLKSSVNQLFQSANAKQKKLLRLLSGTYNKAFTEYLHNASLLRIDLTNEDYYDYGFSAYKQNVYKFLDITPSVASYYLSEVAKDLTGICLPELNRARPLL